MMSAQKVLLRRFIPRIDEDHYLEFDRACLPRSPSDNNATLLPGCQECLCFSGSYVDSVRGMSRGRCGRNRILLNSFLSQGPTGHRDNLKAGQLGGPRAHHP